MCFGASVSVYGNIAVVGDHCTESVYVFGRTGLAWSEQDVLVASDGAAGDGFGRSVAIDGNTIVVGAYLDDNGTTDSGSAYVFFWDGLSWSEQDKLTAGGAATGNWFGISVSISGDTVLVGADDENSGAAVGPGSAYVFVRSGVIWSEQAQLTASDATPEDFFGNSVSVQGDTAVVGAFGDDDSGESSGSVYVFVREGVTWTEQDKVTASDGVAFDSFGQSVGLDGNVFFVGTMRDDDDGSSSGSAYLFVRARETWFQQ